MEDKSILRSRMRCPTADGHEGVSEHMAMRQGSEDKRKPGETSEEREFSNLGKM